MPFFVKMCVIGALPKTIAFGRDDRNSATSRHCGDNSVCVVGLVRNDMFSRQTLDHFDGRDTVVDLAAGQFQANGVAQGVDDSMNFGCQPATTAAYGLGLVPPFPPVAR